LTKYEPPKQAELDTWAKKSAADLGYLWGNDLEKRIEESVIKELQRQYPDNYLIRIVLGLGLVIAGPASLGAFAQSPVVAVSMMLGFVLGGLATLFWNLWDRGYDSYLNVKAIYRKALKSEVEIRKKSARDSVPSQFKGVAPPAQKLGVSHRGAEELSAGWMSFMGISRARVTAATGDGGIDIEADGYIAQVKNYSGTVGAAALRELAGVALTDGRKPMFFTSGKYSSGAIDFANKAAIALFFYAAENGTLDPCNEAAMKMLRRVGAAENASVSGAPKNRVPVSHCPRCDYAPSPEEIRCSECGFYFLLNRY